MTQGISTYMGSIGEITLIHKGEECDVEWKMHFPSLSKEDAALYSSSAFEYEGESWYLGIWPNGSKYWNASGYIYLRLLRASINSPSITLEFTFAIKTVNGQNILQRQRTEDFEGSNNPSNTQLMCRSEFEKRKSEFLVSGYLTIVCTLKRCTVNAKCSYCKETFEAEKISSHEKKCRIKCPECSEVILLKHWEEHDCDTSLTEDESSICESLKEVLLNGLNHDLILKVGDKELRAHQDILRARSQVFKSMLSHDMKEKNNGMIDIPDCDPQAMEQFLCYIYTGKVDSLDESNMLKLYYIADKYDMKGLKGKCRSFIKKSLSNTNICEVLKLALNHSDSSLLEHATEYFKDNTLDIMCTVEWQIFMKDNLTAANELMMKSFQKLKNAST